MKRKRLRDIRMENPPPPPPRKPHILTNDPSMTAWGWAVLTPDGAVKAVGAIKTEPAGKKLRIRKGDDRVRRAGELVHQLRALVDEWNIRLILSELPHGSQNAQAAIMMGMVAGVVETMGACLQIPVEWYSEADAKKALCGKATLSKDHTRILIDNTYKDIKWARVKWIDEAVADAMAVYHVARQQSQLIKMLRS